MAAHLYWRLWILSVHNPTDNMCGILDIKMRLTTGGADQCTGGTPFSSPYEGFNEPSQAFENNEGSWFSDPLESFPVHIGYEFASAKDIVEFTVRADFDHPEYAPATFIFQYSDDGVAWESQSIYYPAAFSAGETKTFSVTTPTTYELLRKIQYDLDALFAIELRRSIQYDLVAPTTFELLRKVKYHLDASQNTLELRRQIAYAIEVPIVFEFRRKIKYDLNGVNTFELKRHITYDLAVPFTSYLYHKSTYDLLVPTVFEKRSSAQWRLEGNALWTPIVNRRIFTLTLIADGEDNLILPMSSFQIRKKAMQSPTFVEMGDPPEDVYVCFGQTYISAIVPNYLPYAEAIELHQDGEMALSMGEMWTDGIQTTAEIARADISDIAFHLGSESASAALTGYRNANFTPDPIAAIVLAGISYRRHDVGGRMRVRCMPNGALVPGSLVDAGGDTFRLGEIVWTTSVESQTYETAQIDL